MADGVRKGLTSSNSLYLKRSKFSARKPEDDHNAKDLREKTSSLFSAAGGATSFISGSLSAVPVK